MMFSKQNYQPVLSDMIIIFSLICLQLLLAVLHASTGTHLGSQDVMTHLLQPSLLLGPTFGVFIPSKESKIGKLLLS